LFLPSPKSLYLLKEGLNEFSGNPLKTSYAFSEETTMQINTKLAFSFPKYFT